MLDSKFRAKLDNLSEEEAFKKAILKSSSPTEVKVKLLDYLSVKKTAASIKILASTVFDYFKNTKEALENTVEEVSVEDLKIAIISELNPSVIQYDDDQLNLLITLIIQEYQNRYHIDYPVWREFTARLARGEII